ncbi:translocation/assembly module TamB domain-containing protein [Minwuia sp. IMCC3077]|uniref:translocation/assembly module TamB domain-containing protein n=1 Tax=Minwuia sp. IMCC3077 TaxID=3040676 RepID=UPI00247A3284|nr:translocation/assembly module TamB domain-containing protein [Minwuia sp. IMCC3077]
MWRRLRKILLWSLAVLLTPVLLLLVGLFWFLEVAGEDSWTAALDQGLAAASTPGEMEIAASGFRRDDAGVIHLGRLQMADGEGVWLTLDDLALDWDLGALLGGALTVESLTVARVDVSRAPVGSVPVEPEPDDPTPLLESFEWPRAPLPVRLDLLRVDALSLGDDLVPGGARFSVKGSVRDAGTDQRVTLNVEPLDLKASFARVDVALDFGTRQSRITMAADLPVLAPLSEPLGITTDERLYLNVEGGGPFGSATIDLSLTVERVADLLLGLRLSADPATGWALDADGVANLLAAAPVPTDLTGETIPFRLAAHGADETELQLARLEVSTASASLSASGSVDLDAGTVNLGSTVDVHRHPALDALLAGATFGAARIEAQVSGALDSPDLSVAADLREPAFGDMGARAISLKVTGGLKDADFDGDVAVDLTEPSLGDPGLDVLLGPSPRLTAHVTAGAAQARVTALDLTAAAFGLSGDVSTPLPEPKIDGELVLLVPELSKLPGADAALRQGSARLVVTADGVVPEGGGEIRLAGGLTGLSFIDDVIQSAVGPNVKLTATARPLAAGAAMLDLSVATASGPALTIDAGLDAAGSVKGEYGLDMAAVLGGLVPEGVLIEGPIRLRGRVSGTADAPRTQGRLELAAVGSDEIRLAGPVLAYDFSDLATDPSGNLSLDGQWGEEVLDVDLRLAMRNAFQQADVPSLSVSLAGLTLEGNASADLSTPGYRANLTAASDELSRIAALFDVPLAGALNATVTVQPEGQDHGADIDVTLQRLEATDAGATVAEVRLAMHLAALLSPTPTMQGDLTVQDIRADGARIGKTEARIGGTFSRPTIDLSVSATEPEPARLTTRIVADLAGAEGPLIDVENLRLEGNEAAIEAVQPFSVRVGETIVLSGLRLGTSFGGEVIADARYAPDLLDATARISALPLGPLAAIGGVGGLQGMLAADVRFDSTAADEKARLSVQVDDLHPPGDEIGASFDIALDANWNGQTARAGTRITGPFESPLVAEVSAEVRQGQGTFLPEPAPGGALQGSIDWTGSLAKLMQLLPEGDHLLEGTASVAVDVSGTIGAPVMQGNVAISDGRYENLMTGTILERLTLTTAFADSGVGELELSAVDPAGGSVSGSGTARLLGADRRASVKVTLDRLRAVSREEATILVSGNTDVTWDGSLVQVVNRTTIDEGEIRLITDNLPPSVVDIELARDSDAAPTGDSGEEPVDELPVALDVVVDAPARLFVRGRGLDSEWSGKVTVMGHLPEPQVDVNIGVVRGHLSLLGKDFQVSTGEIGLTGDMQPRFNIALTRQSGDMEGTISISGSPAKPEIAFSSTPELPEDEVLPRLLFDKSAQSMSPLEAIQLAQSINTLTNGGDGATDKLREAVGLDVLRVEEGADPDSSGSVAVGRYVREGVYVGAKQSLDSEAGSVVVEIDVLPNLKVDAEVGRGGGGSTGLTWERRY